MIDPVLRTFESLQNNIAHQVLADYSELALITREFSIYARDVYSQDEINDIIYNYTIILKKIEDGNLTTESQIYKIAFAILDYFKQ